MRDFRSKENILPMMKKSKLDRSILCWDSFCSKSDWGSYIVSIAKTAAKKVVALIFFLQNLFLLKLLFISINLPTALYGILLSCLGGCSLLVLDKNRSVGLSIRNLLPVLNP